MTREERAPNLPSSLIPPFPPLPTSFHQQNLGFNSKLRLGSKHLSPSDSHCHCLAQATVTARLTGAIAPLGAGPSYFPALSTSHPVPAMWASLLQAQSSPRAFAHAIPSAWNTFLPRSAQRSPPPRSPPNFPCIVSLCLSPLKVLYRHHRPRGLKTTDIYFSWFWRLEVQDQGSGGFSVW